MNAWIFDVDGVLSNLQTREVSEATLFPSLVKILEQGDVLAFNTGRTIVWVEEHIVNPLKEKLSHPSLFEHIFIASEKGGVWKQEGHEEVIQEKFVAPQTLRNKIQKILQDEFKDSMFFDEPKQTMISVEMRPDISLEYFQNRLSELELLLNKYLKEENLQDVFVLQKDKIAIDTQYKNAGKDIGMQHIVTWLETQGHTIEHFYCFGDNPSDLHMGELLQNHGYSFTFVYVGTTPLGTSSFPVVIPQEPYDKGTAEYLKSQGL